MSIISTVIGSQAYELIRNRISEILADEIANQSALGSDVSNATVWLERFTPFDNTELPAVNVGLATGNFTGQTLLQSNGTYQYNIDAYVSAETTDTAESDVLAYKKLHRLLGVMRAILENSQYKTLLFAPPFIMNRSVESLSFADPKKDSSIAVAMGRLSFQVKAVETTETLDGAMIQESITSVKLALTDKGYKYVWLGNGLFINATNPTVTSTDISIPFTFAGLDPLGNIKVFVSVDGGVTFVENIATGGLDLISPAVILLSNLPTSQSGIYVFKLQSVERPNVESNVVITAPNTPPPNFILVNGNFILVNGNFITI